MVPADLGAFVVLALRQRVRDFLGFARRGGEAVAGREAVLEWLRAGRVGLVIQASDGSLAERERLLGRSELPVISPLTGEELGVVFGRDRVVHVAVAPGKLAQALRAEVERLGGFGLGVIGPSEIGPGGFGPSGFGTGGFGPSGFEGGIGPG